MLKNLLLIRVCDQESLENTAVGVHGVWLTGTLIEPVSHLGL